MKVYLDDERPAPDGWVRTYYPDETIKLLETGRVTELSLDHDLGSGVGTGYDVLVWIEEAVATRGFKPPRITVHTANPPAGKRMRLAVRKIEQLVVGRCKEDP